MRNVTMPTYPSHKTVSTGLRTSGANALKKRTVVILCILVALLALFPLLAFPEMPQGEITSESGTCQDPRWFVLETHVTYFWQPPTHDINGPVDPNDFNLEVWAYNPNVSGWVRWSSVPSGRGMATGERFEIPGDLAWQFYLVRRSDGEMLSWPVVSGSHAMCSFMPPAHGSAWVWDSSTMKFELRQIQLLILWPYPISITLPIYPHALK